MGFQYIGPVDGHNVLELTRLFNNLQEQFAPGVFAHRHPEGQGLKTGPKKTPASSTAYLRSISTT